MRLGHKTRNILLFLALGVGTWQTARAQEIKFGGHVGAIGVSDTSKIGYGAHLNINPYGWAAFQADATFAKFGNDKWYFSSSPGVVLYPVYYDEFRLGIIGGPGFYKLPGLSTKFGLHIGATGDFAVTENFVVGMETRYHPVFDAEDVWSVFLTAGFKFDAGGGW
jgi:hypothetical protein